VKPVAVLPALFTLGNAFCGVLAIAKGADAIAYLHRAPAPAGPELLDHFHHYFYVACWLIFLANVFDALDGRLARLTKMTSEFGAMLDSLADMITFGIAPALLIKFLYEAPLQDPVTKLIADPAIKPKVVLLMAFLYVACAAVRLARFTAETEEDADSHDFFKGLPSPAAALFVASGILFYLYLGDQDAPEWLAARRGGFLTFMLGSLPVVALLMVSRVRYVHVVNRFLRGRQPYTYVVQIVLILLLLYLVLHYALMLLCVGYIVGCPAISLAEKLLKKPLWPTPPRDPGEAS
jgi:CDP-diacylglycerol---serine O-phosphatidyltransferase